MAEAGAASFSAEAWDARLAAVLPPGSLFAVGGRVRDELRAARAGRAAAIKDADYVVVGLDYDALEARLAPLGSVDRVGASFSVIKLTAEGATVDIALPRREVSTGSGHRDFRIESGPDVPLRDDLARRDFRMNMIARAVPSGELIDPFDGAADIAAGRIDLLREAAFIEDPLRMLRACQFAARFDYEVSPDTLAAMTRAADLVETVSPQRVGEELAKCLRLAERPSIGVELMRRGGLLARVWPELLEGDGCAQNSWHAHDVYRHNLTTLDAAPPGDLILRLAALLHDVGKPRVKEGKHFYRHEEVGEELVRVMLARVAMPNAVIDEVAHLVRHHMYSADAVQTDAAIRRFVRRVGERSLDRLFRLRQADIVGSGLPKRDDRNERFQERVAAELRRAPALDLAHLAVNGRDVMAAFARAGVALSPRGDRRVGETLRALFEAVTDDPSLNAAETLRARLDAAVAADRASADDAAPA